MISEFFILYPLARFKGKNGNISTQCVLHEAKTITFAPIKKFIPWEEETKDRQKEKDLKAHLATQGLKE